MENEVNAQVSPVHQAVSAEAPKVPTPTRKALAADRALREELRAENTFWKRLLASKEGLPVTYSATPSEHLTR